MRQSLSPAPFDSPSVRVYPGMTAETVVLVTLRHDGSTFLRIELPREIAPAWVGRLERYTEKHDATRPPPIRLLP